MEVLGVTFVMPPGLTYIEQIRLHARAQLDSLPEDKHLPWRSVYVAYRETFNVNLKFFFQEKVEILSELASRHPDVPYFLAELRLLFPNELDYCDWYYIRDKLWRQGISLNNLAHGENPWQSSLWIEAMAKKIMTSDDSDLQKLKQDLIFQQQNIRQYSDLNWFNLELVRSSKYLSWQFNSVTEKEKSILTSRLRSTVFGLSQEA